jgi:hypothetical protein
VGNLVVTRRALGNGGGAGRFEWFDRLLMEGQSGIEESARDRFEEENVRLRRLNKSPRNRSRRLTIAASSLMSKAVPFNSITSRWLEEPSRGSSS